MNTLKKIKNKKLTIGGWMQTSSLDNADIISKSNFDWITIDLEHGNISTEKLKNMCRVIQGNRKIVFARVSSKNPTLIPNILDTGVDGIIIPNIKNSKEVEEIIELSFYPPLKKRGVGFSRANNFGKNFKEYLSKSKNLIVIAMIENIEAYNNLNEILNVKYLDGIFIGPYDLSASMGIVGKFKNRKFLNTIKKIKESTLKKKKICGIHIINNENKELKEKIKEKFNFIAFSMDSVILGNYKKNV